MLNKLKALGEGLGQKVGAWREQAKEKAAVRRMEKQAAQMQDQHAHSRFWLLNVPALATICAAIVEWYWAVLFCIEATGQLGMDWRTSLGSDTPADGAWHFLFDIQSVWVLIGLILATMPIVMLSMIWLPVQFAMRGAGRWRRGSLILVGILANVLVIVSGTVVMNYNRQDQVREAVVTEQTAAQGRAAIDARLTFEQEQLRLALANSNPYLNQAANVGAEEWERSYVAQARATNDPRLPMLERALGAARAADQRRANIERLTVERATAAPEAATAAIVEDNVGRELNTFAQYVEVWRPPFVAFICTLIGIFGAWWTLAMLERLNPKDVLRSGWADDAHRIEDLRDEPAIVPERDAKGKVKMRKPRRKFTDADTGEEIEQALIPEHYRTIKRDKPVQIPIQPDIPPDEQGVEHDGGARQASVAPPAASEGVGDSLTEQVENQTEDESADNASAEDQAEVVNGVQTEQQPELSLEELESLNALEELPPETPVEPVNEEPQAEPSGEDDPERVQDEPPQQDEHVKARALIAAE